MKKLFISIAACTLLIVLAACSNEKDISGIPDNAVRIEATVGSNFAATRSNPVGTDDEQSKFYEGDTIKVSTSEGMNMNYIKTANGWAAQNNSYLTWDSEEMSFVAQYKSANNIASLIASGQDIAQNTVAAITNFDEMEGTVNNAKQTDGTVSFTMKRQMARIIIKIADFTNDFDGLTKQVSDLFFKSAGSETKIAPYIQGDGTLNSTYTVLVPIRTVMSATFNVAGKTLTVQLPFPKDSTAYEKGMSYTYNVKVGKARVEMGEIIVQDWNTRSVIPQVYFDTRDIIVDANTHSIYIKTPGALTNANIETAVGTGDTLSIGGALSKEDTRTLYFWNNEVDNQTRLTAISFEGITEFDNKPFNALWGGAFSGMEKLKRVYLPEGITSIGGSAFSSCSSLEKIVVPFTMKLKTIRGEAFKGCKNLDFSSMDFSQVDTLSYLAFKDCYKLERVIMPKITFLATNTFDGCVNLTYAEFASVTDITGPFQRNDKLTTLKLTAKGEFQFLYPFSSLNTANVNLYLNVDKKPGSALNSAVQADGTWAGKTWKSITYVE